MKQGLKQALFATALAAPMATASPALAARKKCIREALTSAMHKLLETITDEEVKAVRRAASKAGKPIPAGLYAQSRKVWQKLHEESPAQPPSAQPTCRAT